jgi:flavin-binding protein dodecin
MADSAYKLIEVVGTSSTSSDDAVRCAINRAGESLRNLRWFEVTDLRGRIENKNVIWQATVKIGFHLDEN